MNDRDVQLEHTIALGALLHDVGKYLHRARASAEMAAAMAGTHPEVGARFINDYKDEFSRCVDVRLLRAIVSEHHNAGSITDPSMRLVVRLVEQADHLASSEREDRTTGRWDWQRTSLTPIFRRVALCYPPNDATSETHLLHKPLDADGDEEPPLFPQQGRYTGRQDVENHVRQFGREFDALARNLAWDDFNVVFSHLYGLMARFCHCIASDTQAPIPDISLYDHLRVTSAIAVCLYRYHRESGTLTETEICRKDNERQRCALVIGDLSGIQDYLYGIAKAGTGGGVAKRLRARSFFLQLLGEVGAQKVLDAFELPLANLLMASGGKFYILAPNTSETEGRLEAIRKEIDASLLCDYHGSLTLDLGWCAISDGELGTGKGSGFGSAIRRAYDALRSARGRRLKSVLQGESSWEEAAFLRAPYGKNESACRSCGRFPARHPADEESLENVICDVCYRDKQIGQVLPKTRYVGIEHITDIPPAGNAFDLLGRRIRLAAKPDEVAGSRYVIQLNGSNLSTLPKTSVSSRFYANHVPTRDEGEVLHFLEISGESGRLAVIKADVDNLGAIFQLGLRRETGDHLDTPSRIASLSRQLDAFFGGWMNWYLRKNYPTSVYTVYSGGDDLLLVARRDIALRLIGEIREQFARLTDNAEITLSAGIAVIKPTLPIAYAVHLANEELSLAKEQGKNCLCVLGTVLPWDDLDLVMSAVNRFEKRDGNTWLFPSSFLYQMLEFGRMWQRWKEKQRVDDLRFKSMMAYQIARNLQGDRFDADREWVQSFVAFPIKPTTGEDARLTKARKTMDYMPLIAQWVLYGRREKQDESVT